MKNEMTELSSFENADDFVHAPPSFQSAGKTVVPVNFHGMSLNIVADVPQRRATCRAVMRISTAARGCPWLDLVPNPTALRLNGVSLPTAKLPLITPPDGAEMLRMLDVELDAGTVNELEIEYRLPNGTASFVNQGVGIGFFMSDLSERGYLERHAPANLEYDQFPLTVNIRTIGAVNQHRLFSNGRAAQIDAENWRVEFPDYFTCSSCYLHFTNRAVTVRNADFQGIERVIPITVYGENASSVNSAMNTAVQVLRELEADYGAYAHERLVIYISQEFTPGVAGMEYCGATMTMLSALGHELLHSWFARGVMPANGNAGWIDEGIARWRDNGYPRAQLNPNRPPVNLAGFSSYRRHTTSAAYSMGSLFLSELDFRFQVGGGMKPLLAQLYAERRRKVITTSIFKNLLERETNTDLSALFNRFIFGQDVGIMDADDLEIRLAEVEILPEERLKKAWKLEYLAPEIRAYTAAELKNLL